MVSWIVRPTLHFVTLVILFGVWIDFDTCECVSGARNRPVISLSHKYDTHLL